MLSGYRDFLTINFGFSEPHIRQISLLEVEVDFVNQNDFSMKFRTIFMIFLGPHQQRHYFFMIDILEFLFQSNFMSRLSKLQFQRTTRNGRPGVLSTAWTTAAIFSVDFFHQFLNCGAPWKPKNVSVYLLSLSNYSHFYMNFNDFNSFWSNYRNSCLWLVSRSRSFLVNIMVDYIKLVKYDTIWIAMLTVQDHDTLSPYTRGGSGFVPYMYMVTMSSQC